MKIGRLLFFFMVPAFAAALAQPVIIDHHCTDLSQVPANWISQAKQQFRLAYGHTSHGSQIVSGMEVLADEQAALAYNQSGTGGALAFHDYFASGDLGHNGDTAWAEETRAYLNAGGANRNMIMWSWCGGCSDNTENGIDTYLLAMTNLENDYPDVRFVYMTGHLDGSGVTGNLNQRNNQIRQYCQLNNKVLFDFADIESYDPDGNYFLDKAADDGCNYWLGGNQHNWAEEWCAAHPGQCPSCGCAHSEAINCYQKGKAFWWMMARLAGWSGPATGISNPAAPSEISLECAPNPANESMTILLRVSKPAALEVAVYNSLGKLVAEAVALREFAQGAYSLPLDTKNLPQGAYFVVAKSAGNMIQRQFTVQR